MQKCSFVIRVSLSQDFSSQPPEVVAHAADHRSIVTLFLDIMWNNYGSRSQAALRPLCNE